MIVVSASDMRKYFGKYLKMVEEGEEIVITKHGKDVARLLSYRNVPTPLTDSLIGVLQNEYTEENVMTERMLKYEVLL